jgi:Leucine-rich repeat (LRR) protein
VICCWLGWQINAARQQKAAAMAFRQCNARAQVEYDYQLDSNGTKFLPKAKPHQWTKYCGVDFFHDVVVVIVDKPQPDAIRKALPQLVAIPRVRNLILCGCGLQDDDFKYFTHLKELKVLSLINNKLTGGSFGELCKLRNLETLNIERNPLNDANIEYLAAIPKLKKLILDDTHVTKATAYRLKELRPEVEVFWNGIVGEDQQQ